LLEKRKRRAAIRLHKGVPLSTRGDPVSSCIKKWEITGRRKIGGGEKELGRERAGKEGIVQELWGKEDQTSRREKAKTRM